jgi:magnesium transporter
MKSMKMQSTPQPPTTGSTPANSSALSFCIIEYKEGRIERLVDRPFDEYMEAVCDASLAWIDYSTKDDTIEIEHLAQKAGFSKLPIPKLSTGFYSAYEDYDTELGIMLPSATVRSDSMKVHPLFVLIRENLILTVHNEEINRLLRFSRYAPPFFKRISDETRVDKITLMLERIIDENNDRNFEYLREIEMHGDAISKSLIEENLAKKKIAHDIYRMKHVLINYLNVLWATKDVVDSLRYGDADLITNDEKLLGRFDILSDNIDRHIELSEQMSNVLASGLEVMQSIYNNQLQSLNNRFALVTAYLTVLGTAFLVPNTIATIAGSGIMAGQMAAQWWYLPLLIVSTVVATLTSFLWVLHIWKMREE